MNPSYSELLNLLNPGSEIHPQAATCMLHSALLYQIEKQDSFEHPRAATRMRPNQRAALLS